MTGVYRELQRIARRWSARSDDAEDIVQESLLTALAAGRNDLKVTANRHWIAGVIRNKARLAARSAVRRRSREDQWGAAQPSADSGREPVAGAFGLSQLPPALRAVARLALSGLDRREIGHLLDLTDEALRKRISSLGKRRDVLGTGASQTDHGVTLALAYGRIRKALLPILLRRQGHFATHDPDGHLLIIRRT